MLKARHIKQGLSPVEYHAIGSKLPRGHREFVMSNSNLKEFSKCPAKWRKGSKSKDTDSTEWGSLIDCVTLTPERFEATFAICPEEYPGTPTKKNEEVKMKEWNWNATFCKEWRAKQVLNGLTTVKSEDASEAWSASKQLTADPEIAKLINASATQVYIAAEWHDEETGIIVPVKCLLDLVPSKDSSFARTLADLKTCANASPHAWVSQVFDFGYHMQAALYLDAYNLVTGEERVIFSHVLQENSAPYEVGRRILSEEYLSLGRESYRSALARYCRCLAADVWPGYDDDEEARGIFDGWRVVEPLPWMLLP